jgi:hypothetical protein
VLHFLRISYIPVCHRFKQRNIFQTTCTEDAARIIYLKYLLQTHRTENLKKIPRNETARPRSQFDIPVSVSDRGNI